VRFGEGLPAGEATKALQAVAMLAKPLHCVAARWARHRSGCICFHFHNSILQQAAVVCQVK
jgi:hypothetical protein